MSLAIINGDVFGIDEKNIYVEGNRIKKIGEIDSLINKDTTVIDAEGKTVIPGFFDSHTHFANMGLSMESDVSDCRSIEEVLGRIKKKKWHS